MFERYTQAARMTVFVARYIAGQVGSREIETHHLLFGVLKVDKTLAGRFLGSPWAVETVWKMIEQRTTIQGRVPGSREIPLDIASKRALLLASEEADLFSNRQIGTAQLLLGLLREGQSLAAEILSELGMDCRSVRKELLRMPHEDSEQQEFVREHTALPENIVELRSQVNSIETRMGDAIANNDWAKARAVSEEAATERDKLFLLYRQHGLFDWIYE